jgi:hypothetical protein
MLIKNIIVVVVILQIKILVLNNYNLASLSAKSSMCLRALETRCLEETIDFNESSDPIVLPFKLSSLCNIPIRQSNEFFNLPERISIFNKFIAL